MYAKYWANFTCYMLYLKYEFVFFFTNDVLKTFVNSSYKYVFHENFSLTFSLVRCHNGGIVQ